MVHAASSPYEAPHHLYVAISTGMVERGPLQRGKEEKKVWTHIIYTCMFLSSHYDLFIFPKK